MPASHQDCSLPAETNSDHALNLGIVAVPRNLDMAQIDPPAGMQAPAMNLDLTNSTPLANGDPLPSYPTPGSSNMQANEMIDLRSLESLQLPSRNITIELTNLFFDHVYPMLPCFHKKSFLSFVESGKLKDEAPMLLYAICCISAGYHPDDTMKKRSKDWYEQAKFSYELTRQRPSPALRTIQAVLLLTFHAWTVGDFSSSWMFLGKAWRQVVALGLNCTDTVRAPAQGAAASNTDTGGEETHQINKEEEKTSVEREEHCRALWLLLIMDRSHSWPTGWPVAIPETQFKVDLPKPESVFQAMDPESYTTGYANTPFTRNLSDLINSSSAKNPLNILYYITVAHVLLGRVTELVQSLHTSPESSEYAEDCAKLDTFIVKFRLWLPRQANSVLAAPPADREHVVWLQVTLNAMAIILHYRVQGPESSSGPSSPFNLAVIAARNIAQIIKDASRVSVDLLLSAHIGSSLYIAACVLVIQWRLTEDESLKDEIDLFALVFERMDEVFSFLGLKFKSALQQDMKKSREELLSLQQRGCRGLLADCKRWDHAKKEVERRGLEVDFS